MAAPEPTVELAQDLGLVYVNDGEMPGIERRRAGREFVYVHPGGSPVKDAKTLERIRKLAIPPAYERVWICPIENGHIQATGRDARGRKQYRYHPDWICLTQSNKFGRMSQFGSALPRIRRRVDADLRRKGVPKQKACATVVWLLENSLIRVGNQEYAKENKSYGLTTMKNRHVRFAGERIEFKFKGKRGISHLVSISDRRMARILKRISELPGQELFHYVDETGQVCPITSSDVNAYLREISGQDFTAKDFRTWAATVEALAQLVECCDYGSVREARSRVKEMLAVVSRMLGNTPAICRKSYVHPAVLNSFLDGSLQGLSNKAKIGSSEVGSGSRANRKVELLAMQLLKRFEDNAELRNLGQAVAEAQARAA